MKTTLIAALIPLSMLIAGQAKAGIDNCAEKAAQIQTQLDFAKKAGNASQAAGLEKALKETQQHCTNAGQRQRAENKVREKQRDLDLAQQDLGKAEADLQAVQANGNDKKIRKAQKKLADKQGKLNQKTEELRSAQADLAALQS